MTNAAPSPAVEHLPTVFRKIRLGDYRVPAFQRDFIWEEKQVIELMESVYRGFPIGSVLLWRVSEPVLQSIKDATVGFPVTLDKFPASFILDGVQRLSALHGVFGSDDVKSDRRLSIYFDLISEVFFHERDQKKFEIFMPLRAVFNPRLFLAEQQKFAALEGGDVYLDKAIRLLATFQEYMIPVVTIENKSAKEVVDIFQRINSTGVRLGVVDFIRALTWSDEFDLTKELQKLQSNFENLGFTFDDELLLKSLGIVLGLRPLPDVLLSLRERKASELHAGIEQLVKILGSATQFVSRELRIATSEALPYEAQWLFLVKALHRGVDLSDWSMHVTRWIKKSSLFEMLQGRPDHALDRLIDDMISLILLGAWNDDYPVEMNAEDLISKRFLRGKATTVAYVEMLAERGLFERAGREIPLETVPYDLFVPIADRGVLSGMAGRYLSSAKTIGNVIFLDGRIITDKSDVFEKIVAAFEHGDDEAKDLLRIQFIDGKFVSNLRSGRFADALVYRSREILSFAKKSWTGTYVV